jgi:hypothetical protein
MRYLLGHGAKCITERYAHASLDALRKAVAQFDREPEIKTNTKANTEVALQFRTA